MMIIDANDKINFAALLSSSFLSVYKEKDLLTSAKDTLFIVQVFKTLSGQHPLSSADMAKFRELLASYSKKYPKISIKERDMELKIIILEDISTFRRLIPSMSGFREFNLNARKKIDASFDGDARFQENTLTLQADYDGESRLIFYPDDLLEPGSPEFRILIFFCLQNMNKAVDLAGYRSAFNLGSISNEDSTMGNAFLHSGPE